MVNTNFMTFVEIVDLAMLKSIFWAWTVSSDSINWWRKFDASLKAWGTAASDR